MRSCLGRFAVTNAENSYDYAGQDPINGYDLTGAMLADQGIQDSPCACQIYTDSDPAWSAASPATMFKRVTGTTPTKLLRAAGSFSGTCLSGMALGTPEGPAGSVAGCILAVGVRRAKDSPNRYARAIGTGADIFIEARSIQTMRAILSDPVKARQLLQEWKNVIRIGSRP